MSNEIDFSNDTEVDAYDRGQHAYWCTGMVTLSDNPYPAGTMQHAAWAEGWKDAHEDACE